MEFGCSLQGDNHFKNYAHNSDYVLSSSSFINESPNLFQAFIWISDQSDERYDKIRYQRLYMRSETENCLDYNI